MRSLLVLCLVLFVPSAVFAQLKFSETAVNLGEIRGGRPLTQKFSFVNECDSEIEVLEVRPGCGCLAPRLSKSKLAPGEKASLEFDLRTLGQAAGPHTWTAHVRYRCQEEVSELPLKISANVVNDIVLQPSSLNLTARGAMTQELTLADTRRRPLQVKGLHSSSPYLQPRLLTHEKNTAGHWQTKIALHVAADCPVGRHSETLAIYTTDPEYPQLVVPVTVTMYSASALSAQPSVLDIQAGESIITKFVRISSPNAEPVVIETVTSEHPAISCSWARGPENAATVRVRIDLAQIGDAEETTLRIHVAEHCLTVPIRIRRD